MNDKTNKLIEDYVPLANKLAWKKYKITPKSVSIDDLKSAAYFGLVDAANKHNHSSNFSTYARLRINGEMCDYLREISWGSRKNVFSPVEINDDDALIFQIHNSELFQIISSKIKNNLCFILKKYYIDQHSLKDIGFELNLSEGRVSQMLSQAKKAVKNQFSKDVLFNEIAA